MLNIYNKFWFNMLNMSSLENEAKKVAATYARWLRLPEDALFGSTGRGVVMLIYEKVKTARTKDELRAALDLNQYKDFMKPQTFNDIARYVGELLKRIEGMNEEDAVKFVVESLRYFQIALFTKIEDIKKGYWA